RARRLHFLVSPRLRLAEPFAELAVLLLELVVAGEGAECRVGLPPVDAHRARGVRGPAEQAALQRQVVDVEQVHLDVAGDHDALVEHALQDVRERGRVALIDAATGLERTHSSSPCCWIGSYWLRGYRRTLRASVRLPSP